MSTECMRWRWPDFSSKEHGRSEPPALILDWFHPICIGDARATTDRETAHLVELANNLQSASTTPNLLNALLSHPGLQSVAW